MQLTGFYFLLLWIVTCSVLANEQPDDKETNSPVFSKAGNIYYTKNDSRTLSITHSGKDYNPVLSLDKKLIAFVRIGNQVIPKNCDGNTKTRYGEQIWIYDIATKKERLLVANNFQCDKPKKQIVDPNELTFSPDSKILYFVTSAWTTSGALHSVHIDGTHQHYITPGGDIEVLTKGKYKGYLIINQHRYFLAFGGSYDWFWLISPSGKEEGPLGEDITPNQRQFLES